MSAAEVVSHPEDGLLWDSQWVNIVNHDGCYRDYSKEDAVHLAVTLTVDAIKRNIVELYGKTPRQLADEVERLREVLADVRFRISDTRETLLNRRAGGDGESLYGIDEFSTPAVNLQRAVEVIDGERPHYVERRCRAESAAKDGVK